MKTLNVIFFSGTMLFAFVVNSYSIEYDNTKGITTNDTIQANTNKQTPVQDTAKVYTCPMHPEVISANPGKCPKCGMDLVIKEAGANAHNHKGMGCMGMMHPDNNKSHVWMYVAGGAMMVVMMTVMVLRFL